jgi:hypothetical protein
VWRRCSLTFWALVRSASNDASVRCPPKALDHVQQCRVIAAKGATWQHDGTRACGIAKARVHASAAARLARSLTPIAPHRRSAQVSQTRGARVATRVLLLLQSSSSPRAGRPRAAAPPRRCSSARKVPRLGQRLVRASHARRNCAHTRPAAHARTRQTQQARMQEVAWPSSQRCRQGCAWMRAPARTFVAHARVLAPGVVPLA